MNATTRLGIALALTASVAIIECVGGFAAHSVTLLSDSAHVAMDVLALAIALAARAQIHRPATPRQSYGFARMEVLAALGNGALLFTVTAFIIVEAIHRFQFPELPNGYFMSEVAAFGLIINVLVGIILIAGPHDHHIGHSHTSKHEHHEPQQAHREFLHEAPNTHEQSGINLRAALLHVFGDVVGSIAAIIGGLVIVALHIAWIDPVLSLLVAIIIILGIIRIVREAIEVLLESAPSHADTEIVGAHLLAIPGVVEIHDLHIWTLTGAEHLLSAHVVLEDRQISEASHISRTIEESLRKTYMITHVTLQFECKSCEEDQRIICTQRN
jgi:cobalt-zinc-cadmium efflux system protein